MNSSPSTRIFPNPQAVAEGFAAYFSNLLAEKDRLTVALSGGSTPKILFRLFAEHYRDSIDWSKIHFFWGDERCVPPDDSDSNYGMTKDLLFSHIEIPEENIHRVRGEDDPAGEAQRYAEEISSIVKIANDWPSFDLQILGMGGDGHTASIFPHQIEMLHDEKICAVATHPESGQKRISLTGKVLNNSQAVTFLVTGASKTPVIQEIFEKKGKWESYPAAHIQAVDSLTWYLDEAAMGKQTG